MTENEFLLQDRLQKIRSIIEQYGENNFYLSFSGGKDSTVLSALVDMALPNNKIPRVYANTGIELNMIHDFVFDMAKTDDRVVVIKPSVPIKQMLEKEGYPFKSKKHAKNVSIYQRHGKTQSIKVYLGECPTSNKTDVEPLSFQCPKKLRYQFETKNGIKISDKCCYMLKEKPMMNYSKNAKKPYAIIGIMASEGGRRMKAKCLAFSGDKLKAFQPLVPITKEWEDWFISEYNIEICDIYKPPYNFERTGCKGCPFAINLQNKLDTLKKYFPEERKQCEIIWKPVYDEYRRIGYRLKELYAHQIAIDEYLSNTNITQAESEKE
jgi:3'-phosphoadenosine 5'-phosphosulfate sulfotransferase (PAPS reductase)/FAD synthetase